MPTFVLNNPNTINSYGFRVLTEGVDLSRFLTNPVMLNSHDNSPQSLLGRWINIVKNSSGLLLADTDFDTARDSVKEIAGQVDRGFLKGVSMGVSFAVENMVKAADGVWELVKCVLVEASICAVPSNADALKLFDTSGKPMPDSAIKLTLSGLSHQSYQHTGLNPLFTTKEEFYRATGQQQKLFYDNNYTDFLRLFSPGRSGHTKQYQHQASPSNISNRTPGTSYNLSSTITEHTIKSKADFLNASFDVQMAFKKITR